MPKSIRDIMWDWSYWRLHRGIAIQPTSTMLGRLLSGLPSTTCTLCHGHDKIPGHTIGSTMPFVKCPRCIDGKIKVNPDSGYRRIVECQRCKNPKTGKGRGEINGRTCSDCRGSGKRILVNLKVNPAFINSTKPAGHGAGSFIDKTSIKVDLIVLHLMTRRQQEVIALQYLHKGKQKEKAERLNITPARFCQIKARAHEVVATYLDKSDVYL